MYVKAGQCLKFFLYYLGNKKRYPIMCIPSYCTILDHERKENIQNGKAEV